MLSQCIDLNRERNSLNALREESIRIPEIKYTQCVNLHKSHEINGWEDIYSLPKTIRRENKDKSAIGELLTANRPKTPGFLPGKSEKKSTRYISIPVKDIDKPELFPRPIKRSYNKSLNSITPNLKHVTSIISKVKMTKMRRSIRKPTSQLGDISIHRTIIVQSFSSNVKCSIPKINKGYTGKRVRIKDNFKNSLVLSESKLFLDLSIID